MPITSYKPTPTARTTATCLRSPVAIWEDAGDSKTWALSLGATNASAVRPRIRDHHWRCLGVLPAGEPLTDLGTGYEEDFARCTLAGVEVWVAVAALGN